MKPPIELRGLWRQKLLKLKSGNEWFRCANHTERMAVHMAARRLGMKIHTYRSSTGYVVQRKPEQEEMK